MPKFVCAKCWTVMNAPPHFGVSTTLQLGGWVNQIEYRIIPCPVMQTTPVLCPKCFLNIMAEFFLQVKRDFSASIVEERLSKLLPKEVKENDGTSTH